MEARKRGRSDGFLNGNGGQKKNKQGQDTENFQPGIGSKSKPCTKFFSTAGCPFGEGCHFLHFVPGGVNAVAQMTNPTHAHPPSSRNMTSGPPSVPNGAPAPVKTRMCNKINTPEGCKFGEKCHFAHSERELGGGGGGGGGGGAPQGGRYPPRQEVAQPAAVGGFGASATAKISVDASLAGAIIGKSGVHSKHICRVTGAKLSIREHESDTNLKNIELEGTFDQIKQASMMVKDLIESIGQSMGGGGGGGGGGMGHSQSYPPTHGAPAANNFKTKLCENFNKGSCTFGERCHFAHGASELRKSGVV